MMSPVVDRTRSDMNEMLPILSGFKCLREQFHRGGYQAITSHQCDYLDARLKQLHKSAFRRDVAEPVILRRSHQNGCSRKRAKVRQGALQQMNHALSTARPKSYATATR